MPSKNFKGNKEVPNSIMSATWPKLSFSSYNSSLKAKQTVFVMLSSVSMKNIKLGMLYVCVTEHSYNSADLTVSKRPGTSYQIKIHFAVFNHLYLLFSFIKLVETL